LPYMCLGTFRFSFFPLDEMCLEKKERESNNEFPTPW